MYERRESLNRASSALDFLAEWKVPHDWFTSFYCIALSACAFWPIEILYLRGPSWNAVLDWVEPTSRSMSFQQLQVTWTMMLAQSARRLYECHTLESSSTSRMWVGHWVMGVLFYAATTIAIWIEGIRKVHLCNRGTPGVSSDPPPASLAGHVLSSADLALRAPSLRTLFAVNLFILASEFQHDVHAHLASLKRRRQGSEQAGGGYAIPTHPAFASLVAPHYTAECVIYLALAIEAAPPGAWLNKTLICALVFVVVNLGVTAYGTKKWYEEKFGKDSVQNRWRMIPLLY